MDTRIDQKGLLNVFSAWDSFLKAKVHLIACGGTALTLLNVKPSTKDIDLLVPNVNEYRSLINTLKQLGYKPVSGAGWARDDGFVFDLFEGKKVHTTELLNSPLDKGNHILAKEFEHVYLGVLNYYDIIISKLFRASAVDIQDCLALIESKESEIDIDALTRRFRETASFDVAEDRVNRHIDSFLKLLKRKGA